MDKKPLDTDSSSDDEQPKSIFQKIYLTIRANWIAFTFALIIALITIIAVPIIYSVGGKTSHAINPNLSWNVTGLTIANKTNNITGVTNGSFGYISSLKYANYTLYLVDKNNNRILSYDISDVDVSENFISNFDNNSYHVYNQGKSFKVVAGNANGINGSDQSSLNLPNDVHPYDPDTLYIADTMNNRVLKWTYSTNRGISICNGSNTVGLNQPMAIAMDNQSTVYIADYGNNRIVSCSLYSTVLVEIIPNTAPNRNQYISTPISIRYDSVNNTLVIAQKMGYNVVRWQLGANSTGTWTLIAGSASSELIGTSRTLFNQVCNADEDEFGHTYVVDCYNQRIQYYTGDLVQGKTIAGVIQWSGNNTYVFNLPTAVTFDSVINLYVADSNNYRIQRFLRL